jgi:hypothetical protein
MRLALKTSFQQAMMFAGVISSVSADLKQAFIVGWEPLGWPFSALKGIDIEPILLSEAPAEGLFCRNNISTDYSHHRETNFLQRSNLIEQSTSI